MSASVGQSRRGLLVEDLPRTREWMIEVVGRALPDLRLHAVDNVTDALDWLAGPDGALIDIAIVDLGLPDGSGIDIIRYLADRRPEVLPIVATIYDDEEHLFQAMAAGAKGYVLKDEEADVLAAYLRRIDAGEPPLTPSVAQKLLAHFRQPPPAPSVQGLTERETQVLTLLAKGLTVAEAAKSLGLSPQTVASYVKVMYQKLHISSRAEATLEAVRRGLV